MLTFRPLPRHYTPAQEVEKDVAEDEAAAASSSGRRSSGSGGAAKKKKVIELEYVYDADMEGEA